jgi:hypothetical protein
MGNQTSDVDATQPLPPDVDKRLDYWHGLWNASAKYHYFFGVVSVGASVISTSMEGTPAKAFSIVAAIATALIGFMHPERRYMKFVRAWRVLDVAAMRYRHGLIDKAALIDAVERGESLIAEFEDKHDASADANKDADAAVVPTDPQLPPPLPETPPPATP